MIDPALLEAVARRAKRIGVGGDEVLRCHGLLPSDVITEKIANHLGLPVDPLLRVREPVSLGAACAGVLARHEPGWSRSVTVAPRGAGVRNLAEAIQNDPRLAKQLRLADPERFNEHIRAAAAGTLAQDAAYGLQQWRPDLSAAETNWKRPIIVAALLSVAVLVAALTTPAALLVVVEYLLALSFGCWAALRFAACLVRPAAKSRIEIPDRFLPIYSLIIPLYREAEVVPRLIAALKRLDYPPKNSM